MDAKDAAALVAARRTEIDNGAALEARGYRWLKPLASAADDFAAQARTLGTGERIYTGIEAFDAAMRGLAPRELMIVQGYAHCMTYDHQVLTEHGWTDGKALKVGDRIWTLNTTTGQGEWQPCLEKFDFKVNEQLHHFDGRGINATVTANHRWPVTNQHAHEHDNPTVTLKATSELNSSDWLIKARPKTDVPETVPDWLVELVGWSVTEGSYGRGNGITLYQSRTANPTNCARIETALQASGDWCGRVGDNKGCNVYSIAHQTGAAIKAAAPDKVLTVNFIDSLSVRQLHLLIDVLVAADGWHQGNTRRFVTADPRQADSVALVLTQAGLPFSHRERHQITEFGEVTMQMLTIGVNKHAKYVNCNDHKVDFDGHVWCPRTVNGTIYVRHQGTTYWTGNSGKTLFTTSMVQHNHNRRIVMFTADEDRVLVLTKLVSLVHGVSAEELEYRIANGDVEAEALVRRTATEHFPNLVVFDNVAELGRMTDALNECRDYWGEREELCIFDYVGLLQYGDGEAGNVVGKIDALKGWGKENAVPLVAMHQSSRTKGSDGGQVTIDSGTHGGEQQATFVVGVRRKRNQYAARIRELTERRETAVNPSQRLDDMIHEAEYDMMRHANTITFNLVKNKRPPGRLVDDLDFDLDADTGRITQTDMAFTTSSPVADTGPKVGIRSMQQSTFDDVNTYDYEEPF